MKSLDVNIVNTQIEYNNRVTIPISEKQRQKL